VISFYYYLRIVKTMFMDKNDNPIEKIATPLMPGLALYTCILGVITVGMLSYIYDHIHSLSIKF